MSCNCCTPSCPTPAIEWDTVSGTSGIPDCTMFAGFTDPGGEQFRDKQESASYTEITVGTFIGGAPHYTVTEVQETNVLYSYKKNPYCNSPRTCSGSNTETHVISWPSPSSFVLSKTLGADCFWSDESPFTDASSGKVMVTESNTSKTYSNHQVIGPIYGGGSTVTDYDITTEITITLSNPDESDLVDEATASFPAFDGVFGDTAGAFRDVSSDGKTVSLRKGKWRISHYPTPSCYLKVWLRSVWVPESGGGPTYADLTPYVWTLAGTVASPCIPGGDGIVHGAVTDMGVPTEDGEKYVQIVKWSCVDGFEPEGLEDSGFPT